MRTRITPAEWMACTDSYPMLWSFRRMIRDHPRKARLFAVACCRRIGHLLDDPRSRKAIEVARRYADGAATYKQLLAAQYTAKAAHEDVTSKGKVGSAAEWAAEFATATDAWFAATRASNFAYVAAGGDVRHSAPERAAQAHLLRCIFGGLPFAPEEPEPAVPRPIDAGITVFAQTIYDADAFDRLPDLAVLLERHGWTDDAMLEHCRSSGPHALGCWVIDLLLGKN
jgi:hypothetical protein